MKSFMGWVRNKSMMLITYAVLLSLISVIFVYKQQSLIPGANVYENKVVARVNNYEYPWKNAVDAPYITSVWLVTKTGVSTLRSARTISAIASVLSILLFFQLLRNWLLSPGKALVGTVLFATSSWTLIIGRGAHSATVGSFLLQSHFLIGYF
jgi:multisubunit Na+/H+ antiporter MnhB subunit